MTKYLLLLSVFIFSFQTMASEEGAESLMTSDAFEAELRMLEGQEEAAFTRAEKMTNKQLQLAESNDSSLELSDSVSTTNAAVKKDELKAEKLDIDIPAPVVKTRRIRSR